MAEAWQAYVAERSASVKRQAGMGRKAQGAPCLFCSSRWSKAQAWNPPRRIEKTRPGVLVPLMTMRLADVDAKAIAAWLDKKTKQAPTTAAQAFRALRAFLTWCAKHETYSAAVQAGACQSDDVKKRVPAPQTKKDDSLRRAQIKPWFEAVQKIGNPVIAAYLQGLLLTGAAAMTPRCAGDVDFQWKFDYRDKVLSAPFR